MNDRSKNVNNNSQEDTYDRKNGKNSRNRKKNNRSNRSSTSEGYRDNKRGEKLSSLNDLSWYTKNPTLAVSAGSFPYASRPGMNLTITHNYGPSSALFEQYSIPGIAVLTWTPTVGRAEFPTDPINIAAREVYSKVRSVYSGTLDADAPDFLIYMMALDSIYSYIGGLKRIYRTLNTYSPDNYLLPDALMVAYGIEESDIPAWKEDQMALFQHINELIAMVSKFHCPAVMDIFSRHYWMNDNVYCDAATAISQLYTFKQNNYWKFSLIEDDNNISSGGLIMSKPDYSSPATAFKFGTDLINALSEHDDTYTINGYLMRAFPDVPSFGVAELDYSEKIEAVYVEEVLMQIENSTTLPFGMELEDFQITQNVNTNSIVALPKTKSYAYDNAATGATNPEAGVAGFLKTVPRNILSIRNEQPTAADNIIASRLKVVMFDIWGSETAYYMPIYCGTEIPEKWEVLVRNFKNGKPVGYRTIEIPSAVIQDTSFDLRYHIMPSTFRGANAAYITQFDWSPHVQVWDMHPDAGGSMVPVVTPYIMGDVHNITAVDAEALMNLHKVCIYSEFNAFSIL